MRRKTAHAYDFRVRVTTFGNALGKSIVGQIEQTAGETQQQTQQQNADQTNSAGTPASQSAGNGASAGVSPASGGSLAGVYGTSVGPESGITTYAIGDPNAPSVPNLQITTTTDFNGPGATVVPPSVEEANAIRDYLNSQQSASVPGSTGAGNSAPPPSFSSVLGNLGSGLVNGFNNFREGAGSFIADQVIAAQSGGFNATALGHAYNGAVQFTSDEFTRAAEGGFGSTATGSFINGIADRGISGNYNALVDATSQGIEATANYVNTHDANQIAFDVGNVAGDQLPGFVLTAGAGTTLRLGGEAIGALGGVASDGLSAVGDAFINGLSGGGISPLGAQVGAINLDAFSPVARAGLRTSAVISPERATQYLLDNIQAPGFNEAAARSFVNSFDGPITASISRPTDPGYFRYADSAKPNGQGSFLTRTAFDTPADAYSGLALESEFGNDAALRQNVFATQRSIVFEGAVAGGAPGVRQTLVINRNAFFYGTGSPY